MKNIDTDVPISKFIDFVKVFAKDIPENILEQFTREAIIWFCRGTRILRDYYIIECQKGVYDYPIILPDNRELILVENMNPYGYTYQGLTNTSYHNGNYFPDPLGRGDVNYRNGGPLDGYGSRYFKLNKDGAYPVIILEFAVTNYPKIEIVYSWSITRDGCEVPAIIYEEWEEAISSYIISKIYQLSTKVSDMQKVAYYDLRKQTLLDEARNLVARRYMGQTEKMVTRPFLSPALTRRNRGW